MIVNKNQITSYLKTHRKNEIGCVKFTLRDLIDWAEKHKPVPDDPNQVYVPNYTYQIEPEREFRLFMTTKNLIQFTKHVGVLLANFITLIE